MTKLYEAIINFKDNSISSLQINPLPVGNIKVKLDSGFDNINLWLTRRNNPHLNWTEWGELLSSLSFDIILIKEIPSEPTQYEETL